MYSRDSPTGIHDSLGHECLKACTEKIFPRAVSPQFVVLSRCWTSDTRFDRWCHQTLKRLELQTGGGEGRSEFTIVELWNGLDISKELTMEVHGQRRWVKPSPTETLSRYSIENFGLKVHVNRGKLCKLLLCA